MTGWDEHESGWLKQHHGVSLRVSRDPGTAYPDRPWLWEADMSMLDDDMSSCGWRDTKQRAMMTAESFAEQMRDVYNTYVSGHEPMTMKFIQRDINRLRDICHGDSCEAGWWDVEDVDDHNVVATKLCLIHSEISEAMEGLRKQLQDDKLPHRTMIEVELADAMIRIADLAGAMDLDLGGAIAEKIEYNRTRHDHTREARASEGGKRF